MAVKMFYKNIDNKKDKIKFVEIFDESDWIYFGRSRAFDFDTAVNIFLEKNNISGINNFGYIVYSYENFEQSNTIEVLFFVKKKYE